MIRDRFAEFLERLRGGGTPDRERLAAILELNRALAAAADRADVLRLLLDEAIRLFAAERGFLMVPAEGGFSVEASRSLDREPVKRPEQKVSRTIVLQCLEGGDGVFVDDAQEDELSAAQSVADLRLRSVLCMPLAAGEATIGCIYLDHRFQAGAFQSQDLPWFRAFADQAAIVLHLHGLLAQVEKHRADVERRNAELSAEVVEKDRALAEMQEELGRDHLRHTYEEIVGESPALLRHLRLLDRVADGDFPVLLVGESGCGKELAARAIWNNGARRERSFVPINVAAIQPDLLESELFGHVKGAFTGADRDRPGLAREADGGVLFLDEVTEMPLDLQVKLLRFLEDRVVRPVGGDVGARVDLRIVAATNRDPQREVEEGRFRQDLYYRLAVVTVPLPPLRERRADLPLLVDRFLAAAASARGGEPRRATPALLRALETRTWPGNLRELRNEILRLDALADSDDIGPRDLSPAGASGSTTIDTLDLHELEVRAIREALRVTDGNKAEAARLLGISRRSLYDRLRKLG